MSELADKERRAIKILRMYKGDEPIEVSKTLSRLTEYNVIRYITMSRVSST